MRAAARYLIASLMVTVSVLTAAQPAYAISPETRTVARTGAWGLLGGTLVGLAVLPATQNTRGVFIGSSVGLYLGIAVGIFMIMRPEGPEQLKFALEAPPAEKKFDDSLLANRSPEKTTLTLAFPVTHF